MVAVCESVRSKQPIWGVSGRALVLFGWGLFCAFVGENMGGLFYE